MLQTFWSSIATNLFKCRLSIGLVMLFNNSWSERASCFICWWSN